MKKIYIGMLILLSLLGATGCVSETNKPDFIWGGDMIHIDYVSAQDDMSFRLPFLYRDSKENPQFISATGEGLDKIDITVSDDENMGVIYQEEDADTVLKKEGYQLWALRVTISSISPGDKICIDTMTIEIAEKEEIIHFASPIKIVAVDSKEKNEEWLTWYLSASYCFGDVEQMLSYEIGVKKDVVLEEIEYRDYYEIQKFQLFVKRDGENIVGTLPLALQEGDRLDIVLTVTLPEGYENDMISTDCILNFSEGGKSWRSLVQEVAGSLKHASMVFDELYKTIQ